MDYRPGLDGDDDGDPEDDDDQFGDGRVPIIIIKPSIYHYKASWCLLNQAERCPINNHDDIDQNVRLSKWSKILMIDTRLNAATTLREEAGEALKGCKILVTFSTKL